jgi:LysM repeat protein
MRWKRSDSLYPMNQRLLYLLPICVAVLLTGCVSTSQGRRDAASKGRNMSDLRSEVVTLKATVEDLTLAQEKLCSDMEGLRASNDAIAKEVEIAIQQLREASNKSEAARTQLRNDLVRDLSKKMAEIMRSQSSQVTRGGETGREHVVQQGETLSAIASAYGTTVDAIVKANKMQNANSVRAGSRIFIPR